MGGRNRWWWWLCVVVVMMVVVVVVNADTHEEERRRILIKEMRRVEEEEVVEDLPELKLTPQEMTLVEGESHILEVSLSQQPQECVNITFDLSDPLATLTPFSLTLCNSTPTPVTLHTHARGIATLTAHASPPEWVTEPSPSGAFCVVSVMYSQGLTTTADVMGWVYTVAWDASFLPQIVHNWRRKSVVGLSFDFLTFNLLGFFSYFIFNMGLFWIIDVQEQYALRYPQSILHVRLNDVIFPMYALVCTALQIAQCFMYTRAEGQRVSIPCRVVSGVLVCAGAVGCLLVPLLEGWWWLDLLYLLSYIKLTISSIKYVPQLWVNYKSRSTAGWSIYQVILDFTGGLLSLVQMFLLSANYDDWLSILTDPAKLGLGLLSVMFNILFFIQHYCLYRHAPSPDKELKGIDGPLEAPDDKVELSRL